MKKYYAIINAFKFTNKEWSETYSVEWILQSKYPVKWSKKSFYTKDEFEKIYGDYADVEKPNLWLSNLYLEATESVQVVKEMRVWYWRKNYSVKWINVVIDNTTWEKKYEVACLLETDYSVLQMRKFTFNVDQFSWLFWDYIDQDDKMLWIKDKYLEVVEMYKVVENLPQNLE